jgi:hypothetical protein
VRDRIGRYESADTSSPDNRRKRGGKQPLNRIKIRFCLHNLLCIGIMNHAIMARDTSTVPRARGRYISIMCFRRIQHRQNVSVCDDYLPCISRKRDDGTNIGYYRTVT